MFCCFDICKRCECKYFNSVYMKVENRMMEITPEGGAVESLTYSSWDNIKTSLNIQLKNIVENGNDSFGNNHIDVPFCSRENEFRMTVPDNCPYKFEQKIIIQNIEGKDVK